MAATKTYTIMARRPLPNQLPIAQDIKTLTSTYLADNRLPTMNTPVNENRPIIQTPINPPTTSIDSIQVQPLNAMADNGALLADHLDGSIRLMI